MGNKAKVAVLILIILFIAALALAGGVFYLLQQEHNKNVTLQGQLDDLKERQRITENQLQESIKTASDLNVKLKAVQEQLDSVSNELKQVKADKEAALNRVEEFKRYMGQANSERALLEGRLTVANEDIKKAQASLKDIQDQKTQLENKVKELQTQVQGIELGKIVVSPETKETAKKENKKLAKEKKGAAQKKAPEPKPAVEENKAAAPTGALEGKVLVINKEYNFAVLNLGSRDGINVGDSFSAYHNGNYIGDLVVEKLHDSMSAANFVNPDLKDKIAEGDKVMQKSK
ncbi:MAG: hypothetical protein ABSE81_01000 [Candidatus Omnitrophota bacterium]|jgi:DNA repair exonuclease SbcCD ATPase subunit